ncbi:LysR family transcriptional regulator [Brevundimonas sp. SL130]|uniref:LysR family transcriptional regulator n=1 Tax=Brevundimonas sp. SL130 TaxID=2995143 RepID=UPI00226D31AA|nr:LysR family transcriptional regulator [Brevundimonas sp. SL130]WAC61280.1 LysR substrate-binding domain-containing protein [Brevundimonas sp. SL130]
MRWHKAKAGEERSPGHDALARIPLVSLRHALAAAEYLNFRHAANFLGVSQSGVSARIKALEQELGIVLFERRHRGVRLTEAGRIFVAEIAVGIEQLDHAIKIAGVVSTGTVGRLSIGLHSSIASGFLADLRGRFRETYPNIEHVIVEGRSAQTISQVRDGKLDIAFVMGTTDLPDCHSRILWSEAFVIALPIQHPLTARDHILWSDLAPEIFLVRHGCAGPQLQDHIVRRLSEREKTPHIRRCDVGRDTLMHLVASGDGVTLTTESASRVPFPGVVFRPIADEAEQARFSAIWSPHNRSPALKNLLDLATEMSRFARPPEIRTS